MPRNRKPIPAILIAYSDSDFTNPHEAVLPVEPKDRRGEFTHMGARYWGYESSRHRAMRVAPGAAALEYDHNAHNWMLIGLAKRAQVDRIAISTRWFTGNQVRAVSVRLTDGLTGKAKTVLERARLEPDSEHEFRIEPVMATECHLAIYHEGGIARVNLFGAIARQQPPRRRNLLAGARISHVSNAHYGAPSQAVAGDRRQTHMVGWESARTGCGEQALFHLRKPAVIEEVVVDTYLHRLNAPLTAHVFGVNTKEEEVEALMKRAPRWSVIFDGKKRVIPPDLRAYIMNQEYLAQRGVRNRETFRIRLHVPRNCPWKAILPFAPLSPDTLHRFREVENAGRVSHVLYMHFDNGGIHGLKMFGRVKRGAV
jgi:allantoicase